MSDDLDARFLAAIAFNMQIGMCFAAIPLYVAMANAAYEQRELERRNDVWRRENDAWMAKHMPPVRKLSCLDVV